MPTVDELLNNTIESQVCIIDPDTRVINVPACYKEFGVEADEKVNRIKFQCPKIVGDNIDLTTFNLYINYMNARGNYNAYLVDDVTVSGDNITFSWLLSRHVTEKSGTVNYIVCAKKSDDTSVLNEWNTKVATATVGVGLEATTVVEEQNADVIEQILIKLNSAKVQVDYAQNDPNAKDYIKNRPFYGKKGTRFRNTYEDWAAAGGDDGSRAKPILSFIINDEIYKNIAPAVYNGGYTKVYNIPSHEQPKYKVVAYVQNRRIICTLGNSSEEIENWSIYPPEETEEIHYLDPKYIEDMYYTEPEKWGTTFNEWLSVVGENTTTVAGKELTIKYDGVIYENVSPVYIDGNHHYKITPKGQSSETLVIVAGVGIWLAEKTSFLLSQEQIHKIPEKYYNSNSPFVITPTFNPDTETWAIDRTWDEIKAAVAKSENPSDYAISLNKTILSPSELRATKNNSGEITDVKMYGVSMWPEIIEENMLPEGFGSIVGGAQYIVITCFANKDGIDFMVSEAEQTFPVFKFVKVTKSDDGILACIPPNTVELYGFALDAFDPTKKTSFICPLYYDGETYHYESTEKDSSNVTSIYFSTVSNGIYKRLKITQGRNAPDTVVMDKEVDMERGEKWEKIAEIVIPDGAAETNALTINKDINGDQFRLIKARLCVKQPKYTGDSSIPSYSHAMINGKTTGRIAPLAYTSAFRMPSNTLITGSVYEVDVSGAQQIETVYRSGNGGWSDDSGSDFVTYSNPRDEYARYVADTLWAKPITSIGGAGMIIYPGCRYVLYGVRE